MTSSIAGQNMWFFLCASKNIYKTWMPFCLFPTMLVSLSKWYKEHRRYRSKGKLLWGERTNSNIADTFLYFQMWTCFLKGQYIAYQMGISPESWNIVPGITFWILLLFVLLFPALYGSPWVIHPLALRELIYLNFQKAEQISLFALSHCHKK